MGIANGTDLVSEGEGLHHLLLFGELDKDGIGRWFGSGVVVVAGDV